MRRGMALVALVVLALAPAASAAPPSAGLLENERAALKLAPIEQAPDPTYRLIWHPWHGRIAAISVWEEDGQAWMELAHTDGYGTYAVGALAWREKVRIASEALDQAKRDFERLDALAPQLSLFPGDSICLHSPRFALERQTEDGATIIERYCHDDYARDFGIAQALVRAAKEKWPSRLAKIDVRS